MLINRRTRPAGRPHGFTLVEVMVALALGLIVVSAVLALILAIIRSNSQTIQATRLTQELRATASVVAADLRRAGGVTDPLTTATAAGGNPFKLIDASVAGCIRYGYANGVGGNFHAVSLSGGSVFLDADNVLANATCGAAGQRLNSRAVTIDTLTFAVAGRRVDMTLSGYLQSDPAIKRSFTQTVFVRSVGGS